MDKEAETIAKSNNRKISAPKLVHVMTKQEKEAFYEYQTKATKKDIQRLQNWAATSLERVGHIVVR